MSKQIVLGPIVAASIATGSMTGVSSAQEISTSTRNGVANISQAHACKVKDIDKTIRSLTRDHTIKAGEVIGSIAQKYGISLEQLIQIRKFTETSPTNQSVDWTRINIGKTIRVPINQYAVKQLDKSLAIEESKQNNILFNELYRKGNISELEQQLNIVTPGLFPKEVINLGIKAMTAGLRGNMKYDLTPDNPIINDEKFQREVDCAGKIKNFFGFALEKINSVKNLVASELQHAWILLGSLLDIGFTRKAEDNFMGYFDKTQIGKRDIISKGKIDDYYSAIQGLSVRIKNNPVPGCVIGAYFRGSNYKHVVKEEYLKRKKSGQDYHINTHQFKCIGNGEQVFSAKDIRDFRTNTQGSKMQESIDSVDFVINYIQEHAPYQSVRSQARRGVIKKGLHIFHESLDVQINGENISLLEELHKSPKERIQIHPSDTVVFSGSQAMDGFHIKTSDNKHKSENNTTRTFFFIQAFVNPDFIISEKIEPSRQMQNHKPVIGGVEYDIQVQNLLYLLSGDTVETVYKEGILKHIMGKRELLDYSPEQIENLNQIETQKDISLVGSTVNKLIKKRSELRKDRVDKMIATLTNGEKSELQREYARQIRALKLLGYMQNESQLNPSATKTHAPLPLISSETNIDHIYTSYLNKRKLELQQEHKNICHAGRNFLEIRFFEGDTSTHIFERIVSQLEHQADRFPSLGAISHLNELQKQELLRELIDKKSDRADLHITKGIIPSSGNIIVSLPEVMRLIDRLKNESYVESIPTGKTDTIIIHAIAKTQLQRDFSAYTLAQESYESGIPVRKTLKEVADIFNIQEINSFGDLQQRFPNLQNSNNALKLFPNKQHLLEAINNIHLPEIQKIISHLKRFQRYAPIIEADLKKVENIKVLLENLTPENRVQTAEIIYTEIQSLLRFDNGSGASILGKTIALSLLKTKINSHYTKANAWIERTGKSVDDLIDDTQLKERYASTILTIGHRGELTILRALSENYTLRLLQAAGHDTQDSSFPVMDPNWKGQISYNTSTLHKHFDIYKSKVSSEIDISSHIASLKKENFSAQSIYEFLSDEKLQEFLKEKNFDTHIFPTKNEFQTPGVRRAVFDYATPPTGREAPNVNSLSTRAVGLLRTIVENFSPEAILGYMTLLSQILLRPIPRSVFTFFPKIILWTIFFKSPKNSFPKTLETFGLKKTGRNIKRRRKKQTFKQAWRELKQEPGIVKIVSGILKNTIILPTKKVLEKRAYNQALQEIQKIEAKKIYALQLNSGKYSMSEDNSPKKIWESSMNQWVKEFIKTSTDAMGMSESQIAQHIENEKVQEHISDQKKGSEDTKQKVNSTRKDIQSKIGTMLPAQEIA